MMQLAIFLIAFPALILGVMLLITYLIPDDLHHDPDLVPQPEKEINEYGHATNIHRLRARRERLTLQGEARRIRPPPTGGGGTFDRRHQTPVALADQTEGSDDITTLVAGDLVRRTSLEGVSERHAGVSSLEGIPPFNGTSHQSNKG